MYILSEVNCCLNVGRNFYLLSPEIERGESKQMASFFKGLRYHLSGDNNYLGSDD